MNVRHKKRCEKANFRFQTGAARMRRNAEFVKYPQGQWKGIKYSLSTG